MPLPSKTQRASRSRTARKACPARRPTVRPRFDFLEDRVVPATS